MPPAGDCSASLLLVARDNPDALLAQLGSLAEAALPDDVELVVVADGASAAVSEALGLLSGRVRILAAATPIGRRAALASAAEAAEAEVCVALGTLARVTPGFLDPLVAAVRGGAGLAAPVLETRFGDVYGYRMQADRSLHPLGPDFHGTVDALALDCLAAPRELWQAAPQAFDHWRDHYEVSLARVARDFGPLEVVTGSRVSREGTGPAVSVVVCGPEPAPCIDALVAEGAAAAGGEILTAEGSGPRELDAAAATARNEILVFLDAAGRPGPGWIEHLAEAFLDPGVALARGPVRGLWPAGSDPNRCPLGTLEMLGMVDRGDADADVAPGAEGGLSNLAVRRDALLAAGGFEGASAGAGPARAEALVAYRVRSLGAGSCRYASQAAVGAAIAPERAHDGLLPLTAAFRAGAQDAWLRSALGAEDQPPALGARLADLVPLPEALGADDLFARIACGPGTTHDKVGWVQALGALSVQTVVAGRDEARLPSGASVRVERRHADGVVQPPAGDAPTAAAAGEPRVHESPLVTCVIPVFNLERYVGSTIRSVLDQRYPAEALDVVVVDDGSTDGTAEVCAGFGDRIRYIRQDNAGVIAAVDRGVREARGELIGFLDADDQWLPGKTRRQADWMRAHPGVGLLYGDMELIDEADRTLHGSFWGSAGVVPYRGRVFGNIMRWNFVTTGSMMVRASLREAFCPMPEASPWQDWGIAAAIARVAPLDYLPEPTFRYRSHADNHALGADGERLARAHEKDLRFRRAMLQSLSEGELSPHDLRAAFQAFLGNADRLAQARGLPRHAVLPVSAEEGAAAAEQLAEAGEALAGGRLETGFWLLFASLVRNPFDAQAHLWLETAWERLCRRLEGRPARPAHGPADPQAVDRVLADCAGTTVVAHVPELLSDPRLLESFASAFRAGEATLVAYAPDIDAHEVYDGLAAAVASAGLDGPGSPDVVLFDVPGAPAVEERLAAKAQLLLTRRLETSPLGALPARAEVVEPALTGPGQRPSTRSTSSATSSF